MTESGSGSGRVTSLQIVQESILNDGLTFSGGYIDVKASVMQNLILKSLAALGQKTLIRINSTMDEGTSTLPKLGTSYYLGKAIASGDSSIAESCCDATLLETLLKTITATQERYAVQLDFKSDHASATLVTIKISINGGTKITVCDNGTTTHLAYTTFSLPVLIPNGAEVKFYASSNFNPGTKCIKNVYLNAATTTGSIKSNAIAADANIIRYFEKIKWNLAINSGTTLKLKLYGSSDSYATALNSTAITIPSSEYTDFFLERKIVLTATSTTQTIWDFTNLTGADNLINQIGCQYILLVEKSLNGTDYLLLEENVDYYVDISLRTSPRITLSSGTSIVSGTSKIRATMVIDILKIDAASKNTSIKVEIEENGTGGSPTMSPLPIATSQYLSVDYVARY